MSTKKKESIKPMKTEMIEESVFKNTFSSFRKSSLVASMIFIFVIILMLLVNNLMLRSSFTLSIVDFTSLGYENFEYHLLTFLTPFLVLNLTTIIIGLIAIIAGIFSFPLIKIINPSFLAIKGIISIIAIAVIIIQTWIID